MQTNQTPEDIKANENLQKALGAKTRVVTGSHDGASYANHSLRPFVENLAMQATAASVSVLGVVVGPKGESMFQCFGNMGLATQAIDSFILGLISVEENMREHHEPHLHYVIGIEYINSTVAFLSGMSTLTYVKCKGVYPELDAAISRFFKVINTMKVMFDDYHYRPFAITYIQKFIDNNYDLLKLVASTDPQMEALLKIYKEDMQKLNTEIINYTKKK